MPPLPSTTVFAPQDKNYIAALNQLVTDINALFASFQATTAGAFFSATSSTSNSVGTGSKAFTLIETTQRAFALGMSIRIADTAAPATNYMDGQITAYAHPSITVSVTSATGSGTKTAWTLSLNAVSGILPIVSGGTGASDAATARTNLGLGTAATHATGDYATSAQGTTADNALPKAGGTMSGAIAMGANNITGLKLLSFAAEYDAGDSGAAKTIDFANGQQQKLRLTAATTITVTAPSAPGHYQLRLVQDGTGGRTVTWSGLTATRWGGSTSAPAVNSAINGETMVNLYYDGSTITQTMFRVGAV